MSGAEGTEVGIKVMHWETARMQLWLECDGPGGKRIGIQRSSEWEEDRP